MFRRRQCNMDLIGTQNALITISRRLDEQSGTAAKRSEPVFSHLQDAEHTIHHADTRGPDAWHFKLWIHVPLGAPAQRRHNTRIPADGYLQRLNAGSVQPGADPRPQTSRGECGRFQQRQRQERSAVSTPAAAGTGRAGRSTRLRLETDGWLPLPRSRRTIAPPLIKLALRAVIRRFKIAPILGA